MADFEVGQILYQDVVFQFKIGGDGDVERT